MEMLSVIDVRTIFILLPFTALLMALVLWLGPRSERREGLGRWIVGLSLISAGWLLMAARGAIAPVLSVALADSLIMAGLLLQVSALYEFRYLKTLNLSFCLVPASVLFAVLFLIPMEFRQYSLLASFVISMPLLVMGVQSWSLGESAVRWPMAFFYIAGGILLQARALHIWFSEGTDLHFFSSHPLHIIAFIESFAMTISGSFGFLEMQRWRAEKNIRYFAMYDELTDLLNRRSFFKLAERERVRARRRGKPIALLMLDLDHFKAINDRHGHFIGDRVLKQFAVVVKENLRADDLLCRSGGEEFMALLTDVRGEKAVNIAQRVRAAVQEMSVKGLDADVTVSIGVAMCDDLEEGAIERGLKIADNALYEAKNNGRNQVVLSESAV
jgi:diguanylate cyclase (GGDEF)-like protein